MCATHVRQVPRFTTMLRSFAASGSAADDSAAAQHVQQSALLQRKRAQVAAAQVRLTHASPAHKMAITSSLSATSIERCRCRKYEDACVE